MNLTDIEVLLFVHHLPSEKVHFTKMEHMLNHIGRKELYASVDRLQANQWIEKEYQSGLPRTLFISMIDTGKKEAKAILTRIGKYCIMVHKKNLLYSVI